MLEKHTMAHAARDAHIRLARLSWAIHLTAHDRNLLHAKPNALLLKLLNTLLDSADKRQ